MTNQPNREKEIFERALDFASAEDRQRYLESACGDDTILLARVQALLRADEAGEDFLPVEPKDTIRIVTEKPGDTIGRYKLLQQIGEGGCGVVYMADQAEPVRRRVALKIIKLGMDTKSVIARFEAERQALALMDHPNIAKVFDAGATDTGRPYFVMELVRGIRITDYCDENNLSTEDRLKLFTQVCHAIQHAHQKGVIHRDIKPSNILVTVNDAVPVPKIIDFGIAKATSQQLLTDKTLFTAFEQFIGTPAYMSPEQAVMTSLDIDTRSDIYSLGVLLYELLTGKTPFDATELLKAGLDEIRRTIREQEPPKPSTRLSTMLEGELTTTAKHRQSEAPKLINLLRGDLDWVVMKALEKDRTRRYETANGLARDVQRYLDNEPVAARPPSRLYRFQKTVQRNKLAFGAAAAVALALVIGLAVSTAMFLKAKAEKKNAQTEAAKSQQVAQFLKDMLNGVGPSVAMGRDTTMLHEIVDKTARSIATDLKAQPEVQIELRLTLAEVYHELGAHKEMEQMARGTLALARSTLGEENLTVADALGRLGDALHHVAHTPEAESVNREAAAMQRRLRGPGSLQEATALYHFGYSLCRSDSAVRYLGDASLYHLANPLDARSNARFAEAESAFGETLAIRRKKLGNDNLEVARALDGLSEALGLQNKMVEAEAAAREALAIRQKVLGSEHPELNRSLGALGNVLTLEGKYREAEELYHQLLPGLERTMGKDHPTMIGYYSGLIYVLLKQGKSNEANALLERQTNALTGKESQPR